MRSVADVKGRLDKARNEYLREVDACDRELQGLVRIDPTHLKAAHAVQKAFAVDPEPLELKANEQPEAPTSKKKK